MLDAVRGELNKRRLAFCRFAVCPSRFSLELDQGCRFLMGGGFNVIKLIVRQDQVREIRQTEFQLID